MTKHDVVGMLAVMESEYPQSFVRLDDAHMTAKVNLWAEEFARDDPKLVFAAVRTLMRSGRQWAPTSGEIREKMTELSTPEELSETAVLDMVTRAASNGTYHAEEEFTKLPPELQEIVHSPGQLREWAMMDAQTFQSVIGSFVMKAYRVGLKRAKDRAALPENVRELIGSMTERTALPK